MVAARKTADPTAPIRKRAAAFADVVEGTSCNQTSFKVGKHAFLYIGAGAKGQGFKAMFKLDASMGRARQLAAKQPERYGVGSNGWVSVRFSIEEPLAKGEWEPWLKESCGLACGTAVGPKSRKAPAKRAAKKR